MADNDQIRDYLLGQMPEVERLKIEEEYFANPEALMAFWADSNDFIDDYLRGKLSLQERWKFEQHLKQLPAIREKVETDRALLQALDISFTAFANQSNQRTGSTRRWSLSQWWSEISFPAAVTAVLLLGLMVGGIWYSFTPEKAQIVRQEVVKKEVPLPPVPDSTPESSPKSSIPQPSPRSVQPLIKNQPAPVIASFLLSAEIIRGNEAALVLPITLDVTILRLQLELSSEAPKNFRAVLQTREGATIKVWEALSLVYEKSTPIVVLNLPVATLTNTEYVIKLSSTIPPQEFHFRLQKNSSMRRP